MADKVPLYRVREGFAVPTGDGVMRAYTAGQLIGGSDPIAKSHGAFLEPASNAAVEAATANPGERRVLGLKLPSGRPLSEVAAHRTGHAHTVTSAAQAVAEARGVRNMPFRDSSIQPDDPRHPASTFAPAQPAAGVVAPDVPDEQNLAGAPKAGEENVDVKGYTQTATDPRAGAGPVPRGQKDPETGEEGGSTGADAADAPVVNDDGTATPADSGSKGQGGKAAGTKK